MGSKNTIAKEQLSPERVVLLYKIKKRGKTKKKPGMMGYWIANKMFRKGYLNKGVDRRHRGDDYAIFTLSKKGKECLENADVQKALEITDIKRL